MTGCHFSSLVLTNKLCFELLKIIATTNHNNWYKPDKGTAGTNTQLILKSFWKKVNQIPQSIKTSRRLFSLIYPKSSSNHQHIFGYVRSSTSAWQSLSVTVSVTIHFSVSYSFSSLSFSQLLAFWHRCFLALTCLTLLWARQSQKFFVLLTHTHWLGRWTMVTWWTLNIEWFLAPSLSSLDSPVPSSVHFSASHGGLAPPPHKAAQQLTPHFLQNIAHPVSGTCRQKKPYLAHF